MKRISVLILAAGNASRMGRIKQLLPYNNSTLLQVAINNALASKANDVHCVLGANSEIIQKEIKADKVTFINNPNWQEGLSSSIVAGVEYLKTLKEETDAIMIMLADQPKVDKYYLNELIDLFKKNENKIIASIYKNRKGVPAIFPSTHFNELLQLKGDKGANLLLNNSDQDVISPDLNINNILKDIDTPEDYKRFIKDT
ncbi:nucleotidyltransferase family protein [Flaviramulus sp. BrNp1-15]|uniref:nucleotidyltransferase family protein n=1 Tax=Flaviramulus sp. BrNp1-15 TaxID=2916754 RepID=UPI001EE86292|nr:nucleotidyltransferase family protein [Flaviramulus sp. BrNp1-15]ULC59067.1 nucleotidyltransferase family protein [Flaviramulus sp. BrNp1-15]